MTGELRSGDDRSRECPRCGQPKTPHAELCRYCRADAVYAEAPGRLRAVDEGYGPTCPECGGPKMKEARRCKNCFDPQAPDPDAVFQIGRHEATITFREADGRLFTLVCIGRGKGAQIADGLGRLPLGEWTVECVSTPATILADLRKTAP